LIDFYITGQSLKFYSPVIAADTLNYLSARFHFDGADWQGLTKWVHFRQGDTVYDLALDEEDEIKSAAGLNLHIGYWQVYLTGHGEDTRLTTDTAILMVKKSGLVDAPLHELPQSVAEQLAVKADSALQYAKSVHEAAERGDFTGQSFQVLGYFATLSELQAAVPRPDRGSVYGVGSGAPYDIYIWDSVNGRWHNNGPIQGASGEKGERGATFTPHVDESGKLSWTNDAGLNNPETVSIMGPKGDRGDKGADGQSPFEAAVAEGFTGTASTFNSALVMLPQHAARHGEGGVDALPEGSVSEAMIATNAVSREFSATVATGWSGSAAPYSKATTISGLLATDKPIIDLVPSSTYATAQQQCDAWAQVYRAVTAANTLTLYAHEKPTVALPIQLKVVRK